MSLTLNQTLAQLGYTTQVGKGLYKKDILLNGEVVYTGDASEVWDWLTSNSP